MSKTIWYFISGGIETFKVAVNLAETVADLKKQIKRENPDLNASYVALYRGDVDEAIDKQKKDRMKELNRLFKNLDKCVELDDEQQEISEFFGEGQQGRICYVLVQPREG